MQNKNYHIPFIVNLIILIMILAGIYIAWHLTTGNSLAVVLEKPNQEIILIEKDSVTGMPKKIGVGNTYYEAIQKSISTEQLINYLYNYILEPFNTNKQSMTNDDYYKIEWVTPNGVIEHSETILMQ